MLRKKSCFLRIIAVVLLELATSIVASDEDDTTTSVRNCFWQSVSKKNVAPSVSR